MERDPWAKLRKTERDARILDMYERNPELSMADIGRLFNISRERVRQIVANKKEKAMVVKT